VSEILDCNGLTINIGDKVKRVSDGQLGDVTDIVRPETHKTRMQCIPLFFGDLVIATSSGCRTISNNYSNWQVI